ncbi:hypothetical protein LQ564_23000 [Massilia sp. G4R7]|uniref:Uncharacterized protein n=1 Tax=Massilia phyllostachyos TaxID=2898585 RepID=A0ABS8QBS0_9BURK|nr:hypothetical protein [Massilia phyllostachyos]MCD2519175.1 hypothetical protein [Massilia phyllostachyos]
MPQLEQLSADDLADMADRVTAMSIALYEYRVRHSWLTPTQASEIREDGEARLDRLASLLRCGAIRLAVRDADLSVEDLKHELEEATAAIRRIETIKGIIDLAAQVVSLGGAILSRDAKAMLTAAKGVKDAREKLTER